MDPSTDSYVFPRSNPEKTQLSDPNPSSETKIDSPRKLEKTDVPDPPKDFKREAPLPAVEGCTRDRLKKHRQEMAGRVGIPDKWGQEGFLKDWKESNMFDRSLVPKGLVLAREALVEECRKTAGSNRPIRATKSC